MSSNSTLSPPPGPPPLPPASVQRTECIQSLNYTQLYLFMMGAYAPIAIFTLYLYTTRKAKQRKTVLAATSLSFLISLVQVSIQIVESVSTAPASKNTLEEAFIDLNTIAPWSQLALNVTTFLLFIVADLLLIWRCYHIWGESYRVIVIPLFLVFAETGLSLAFIIYLSLIHLQPTNFHQANTLNHLISSVYYVTLSSSLITSGAIAYRIYTSLGYSLSTKDSSRKRFIHILEIIVQSSAVYSVFLLLAAVGGSIPVHSAFPSPILFSFDGYAATLLNVFAGMIPTIMVARVCMTSSNPRDDTEYASKLPTMPAAPPENANDSRSTSSKNPQIETLNRS